MKQKRKSKLIALLIVIFLITIISYGIAIYSTRTCYFDYNGIEYYVEPFGQIALDASDLGHKENFLKANYSLSISFENKSQHIWRFNPKILDVNDTKISLAPSPFNHEPFPSYRCPANKWCSFSIRFNITSSDPYISNKTYFGNTNVINGSLRVNLIEDKLSVHGTKYLGFDTKFDKTSSNVLLHRTSDKSMAIGSDTLSFPIRFIIRGTVCP
jgi:hypothetical protein